MIIIIQFDWLADRRSRRQLLIIVPPSSARLRLFRYWVSCESVCVCVLLYFYLCGVQFELSTLRGKTFWRGHFVDLCMLDEG